MKATSNPESEAIRRRFFEALKYLKPKGFTLKHIAEFYDLDASNVSKLKSEGRQAIPAWYIAGLSNDFGISAEWLLFGTGEMVKNKD